MPSELKYTNTHEWVRPEGGGVFTVGLTDHAQSLLGDMVFVDLPELDAATEAGEDCAIAESVKAASDVYAPLTGLVVAVNEDLENSPELLNSDPYGDGWLFQIKVEDESEFADLLDADNYLDLVDESE
ncbi:glycine cleavage system protein GcvH [uncultured Photobacterium sp.]|uniref:glycine cleavage system protein GcvH n=1 Tax=uncultured Photobacterium sp. TaxID=173973 RepID=UPI00345D85E7